MTTNDFIAHHGTGKVSFYTFDCFLSEDETGYKVIPHAGLDIK